MNTKPIDGVPDLDAVLDEYAKACDSTFNAEVLAQFIEKHPQHRDALNRFAHVQLSSVRATPEEIAATDAGVTGSAGKVFSRKTPTEGKDEAGVAFSGKGAMK